MCHTITCDLPGSNTFFHVISLRARIKKNSYWAQNVCCDFIYKLCKKISYSNQNWTRWDQEWKLVFM